MVVSIIALFPLLRRFHLLDLFLLMQAIEATFCLIASA